MLLKVQNHNELQHIKKAGLRGLDGDASLLLVLPGVGGPGLTGLGAGNDTSLGQKGVGQCGLAVVDVSNNTHVTNVMLFVHDPTDLVHGEIDLRNRENITLKFLLVQTFYIL